MFTLGTSIQAGSITFSPQIIARAQSFMVSQVPQLLTWASYFSVFLSDSLTVPNCCEINIMSAIRLSAQQS